MRVRQAFPHEHDLFNSWRRARGVPELPGEMFPPTGAVCLDSAEAPMAVAWLYLSNASLAYLAWPTTRPGLAPRLAREALTLVFTQLLGMARELRIAYIVSTSDSRGLTKLLQTCGMKVTGSTHAMLSLRSS